MNSEEFKGVSYAEDKDRWVAEIQVKGKRLREHFLNKSDAINQRMDWEKQLELGQLSFREKGMNHPKLIDLTNQTFGELTAISYIKLFTNKPGKWLCKCTCGNDVERTRFSLISSKHPCCGCKKKRVSKVKRRYKFESIEDRVGMVYGDFKLISYDPGEGVFFCECVTCKVTKKYKPASVYTKIKCCSKPQKPIGDINNFMTNSEAAERWGVSLNSVKERIKSNRKYGTLDALVLKGLIKPPYRGIGNWILSTQIMREWYGDEVNRLDG